MEELTEYQEAKRCIETQSVGHQQTAANILYTMLEQLKEDSAELVRLYDLHDGHLLTHYPSYTIPKINKLKETLQSLS